jgi:hypothetical protein
MPPHLGWQLPWLIDTAFKRVIAPISRFTYRATVELTARAYRAAVWYFQTFWTRVAQPLFRFASWGLGVLKRYVGATILRLCRSGLELFAKVTRRLLELTISFIRTTVLPAVKAVEAWVWSVSRWAAERLWSVTQAFWRRVWSVACWAWGQVVGVVRAVGPWALRQAKAAATFAYKSVMVPAFNAATATYRFLRCVQAGTEALPSWWCRGGG